VLSQPDEYIRQRVANGVVAGTAIHEFADAGSLLFGPSDAGRRRMATHEDITGSQKMSARLKSERTRQTAGRDLKDSKPAIRHRDQQHVGRGYVSSTRLID